MTWKEFKEIINSQNFDDNDIMDSLSLYYELIFCDEMKISFLKDSKCRISIEID